MVSRADEILGTGIIYRLMIGTHNVLRNLGFPAASIFTFVGGNAGIELEFEGASMTISCTAALDRPYEVFCREWCDIVANISGVSDAMLDRCKLEWNTHFDYAALCLTLKQRGFRVPELDAMVMPIVERFNAEAEGKLN